MTISYSYVDWLQIFRILAAFCFGIAFGVILIHYVHAQDIDPRYTCLYEFQYPFNVYCNQQRINDLIDQLDQRAREFNSIFGLNHSAYGQQIVNMTIYPKTLSFCYPVKHLDAVEKVKKDYVECNYVEMPNKKLKHVRDFLQNWTAQK